MRIILGMSTLQRQDYQNYGQGRYNNSYQPRRTVKTFHDLEVYQKSLEAAVYVANVLIKPMLAKIVAARKVSEKQSFYGAELGVNPIAIILKNILPCALGIPHLIAEAHSLRFGAGEDCLVLLEKAMLNCNKMVVYLEEIRDIGQTGLEAEVFEEKIKEYFRLRYRVLNLQRSWKRFIDLKRMENTNPLDTKYRTHNSSA